MTFPEPGRRVGHVLLDGVLMFDHEEAAAGPMSNLAIAELAEIEDAVRVTVDGDDVGVDFSNLVGGALVVARLAVQMAAYARGESIEDVVSILRFGLDT
jgi:hypothetical protein